MKRLLLSGVVTFTAVAAAFAFDPHAIAVPQRMAIVQCVADAPAEVVVELSRTLRDELRKSGVDVHVVPDSIDDLRDGGDAVDADVLIEVSLGPADSQGWGGLSIGGPHVGAGFGLVHRRIAAEVRLYDAASLEEIESFVVEAGSASPALTSIGFGDGHGQVWLGLPIGYRGADAKLARSLAKDAAGKITRRGSVEQ